MATRGRARLREAYLHDRTAWRNRLTQAQFPVARRQIRATLKHLESKIENLDQTIERIVERQADLAAQCRALQTIKGIGKVTAVTLTAELGDLTRYGRNRLVAAAGLYPKKFTSGKTVWRRSRLAKGGGGLVQHPVTGEIAEEAARMLRSFSAREITLDAFDALIAATARLEDLTLLTYNVRHYPMKDIEVIAP